jgi:hypothetical protein
LCTATLLSKHGRKGKKLLAWNFNSRTSSLLGWKNRLSTLWWYKYEIFIVAFGKWRQEENCSLSVQICPRGFLWQGLCKRNIEKFEVSFFHLEANLFLTIKVILAFVPLSWSYFIQGPENARLNSFSGPSWGGQKEGGRGG